MAKNITIETNSNLFALINVDMYNTELSPENIIEENQIEEDYLDGEFPFDVEQFWQNYSFKKYKQEIELLAEMFFNKTHICNDFEIKVKTGKIISPLYYNYSTDTIDFDVTFNNKELINYIKSNLDEFDMYLKENYTSVEGFIYFVPNNYNEWLEQYKQQDVRCLSAALDFIFTDEFKQELNDSFVEFVRSNLNHYDLITEQYEEQA
jgi:hypothetical protein